MSGIVSYLAGQAAEDIVASDYERRGLPIVARRWRGSGGEIDLIARLDDGYVFIEVKKSRAHSAAAAQLRPAQMQRIYRAASEFIARSPTGQDTNVRFDAVLMDASGTLDVIENAFGH